MKHARLDPPAKRTVVIQIDEELAVEAEALGMELEQTARTGVFLQVRRARAGQRWKAENRPAIEAMNRWVEENGLPLERYRLF